MLLCTHSSCLFCSSHAASSCSTVCSSHEVNTLTSQTASEHDSDGSSERDRWRAYMKCIQMHVNKHMKGNSTNFLDFCIIASLRCEHYWEWFNVNCSVLLTVVVNGTRPLECFNPLRLTQQEAISIRWHFIYSCVFIMQLLISIYFLFIFSFWNPQEYVAWCLRQCFTISGFSLSFSLLELYVHGNVLQGSSPFLCYTVTSSRNTVLIAHLPASLVYRHATHRGPNQ